MASTIEISTVAYQNVHGRKPRGYTLWYFRLPGGLTFSHSGTYGSAARALTLHARQWCRDGELRAQLCA